MSNTKFHNPEFKGSPRTSVLNTGIGLWQQKFDQ